MADYILDHHQAGERERLALMSRLLDPMHRRHIECFGIGHGARALEVGCGNGSIAAWLVDVRAPNVEFRQGDILAGPVEQGGFDLVTARAVLHHLPNAPEAIANLVASARRGGAILLIEPDFLPVSVAEPPEIREFWAAWLSWSRKQGIDYTIGRQVPERLAALGLEQIGATAETALYNGGSPWAQYWQQTIVELRGRLIESGELNEQSVDTFLAYCEDPSWWTQTIAFTAVHARVTR